MNFYEVDFITKKDKLAHSKYIQAYEVAEIEDMLYNTYGHISILAITLLKQ